jgi:hypothetical protein
MDYYSLEAEQAVLGLLKVLKEIIWGLMSNIMIKMNYLTKMFFFLLLKRSPLMLKNLLQRVVPSLAQFRENRLKKKYEKKKQRIYLQIENRKREREQRFKDFLKANQSIHKE